MIIAKTANLQTGKAKQCKFANQQDMRKTANLQTRKVRNLQICKAGKYKNCKFANQKR